MNLITRIIYRLTIIIGALAALTACSSSKFIDDEELFLHRVKVTCDDPTVNVADMKQYVRQSPNTKWLSTFKVPLAIYSLSGRDTTKWINRVLQSIGEEPVILDYDLVSKTQRDLTAAMQNKGYLDVTVDTFINTRKGKTFLDYHINPGSRYYISNFTAEIKDSIIADFLDRNWKTSLHSGTNFTIDGLNQEMKDLTKLLQNNGYYLFNKEFIHYDVDSSRIDHSVSVRLTLDKFRRNSVSELTNHPCYTIDSIVYEFPHDSTFNIRRKVLENNTVIKKGSLYSISDLLNTYNKFSRLSAIRYTNIQFRENYDDKKLNCHIQLSKQRTHSWQFQPEGTNTAGDLGVAASMTYKNRNLFHGAEQLSITLRGNYESITKLEGYNSGHYEEYGIETSLTLPHLFIPGLKYSLQNKPNATSELLVSYNLQNRPEFHRRLFRSTWRYRWTNPVKHQQYRIDLIDLNYLSMPWISQTFKHDYLDNENNRNAILRYNYEDLFILRVGFGYTWSSAGNTLRLNVETAGNLLSALSRPLKFKKNSNGEYELFHVSYAQYAKADADYSHVMKINQRSTLVLHGKLGIAYPYGNSKMLPFEKRYFSGGANSLRGWSVRSLGPGSYVGKDGRIDFINQTGDLRLDLNAELRSSLFWKFQGALFIDAGNIWTIRDYPDQPEGRFMLSRFYKQIAANYGLGIRLNFDYFVLRFDIGVKAVNPTGMEQRYPLFHPKLSQDCAFHFAVGMPF